MTDRSCLAIVLAAGEGTRMRSALPKVLHPVGGRPMLAHVLTAAETAGADRIAVVLGHGQEATRPVVERTVPYGVCYTQEERRGTAHAVLCARPALESGADDVIVLCGDAPLIRPETIRRVRTALARGSDLVVVGFEAADPTGYGRLLVENGRLVAIREEKDAGLAERMVRLCNSGILGFRGENLPDLLDGITDQNAKREFYLTDAVAIANGRGLRVSVEIASEEEVLGVNDRAQLSTAEAVFQRRARASALSGGVTLVAPETVWFSCDTILGRDVVVEPNVVFGPGVVIGDGATIHAFSHLEGAIVGEGVSVGPFARLRPGTHVADGARVGNFVEIKNSSIEEDAKVNHLTYIGDARVGAGANIGAGTITCNYDGFGKYHTDIGSHAFIGSNSALVAPVVIGDGAFVASGSVVTDNVPADALAVARGRQALREGWAVEFRAQKSAEKAATAAAATAAAGLAAIALAAPALADDTAPDVPESHDAEVDLPVAGLADYDGSLPAETEELLETAGEISEAPAFDIGFLDDALDSALADAPDADLSVEPEGAPEDLTDAGTAIAEVDASDLYPELISADEIVTEDSLPVSDDDTLPGEIEAIAVEPDADPVQDAPLLELDDVAADDASVGEAEDFIADLDLERLMGAALAAEVLPGEDSVPAADITPASRALDGFEDAFLAEDLGLDALPEDLPDDHVVPEESLPEDLDAEDTPPRRVTPA